MLQTVTGVSHDARQNNDSSEKELKKTSAYICAQYFSKDSYLHPVSPGKIKFKPLL